MQTLAQLGPEAIMNIDTQALARKIIRDGDLSPEAVRTEREVKALIEQQQQQMQAQQMMQVAQQLQNPENTPDTQ